MVFRNTDGIDDGVNLSGVAIVYIGDLPHATSAEVHEKGSEGAIYISDDTTPEQREILNELTIGAIGGVLMKKVIGTKYVKVDIEEGIDILHVKIPSGEMKMCLTKSNDGNPVRIENSTLPFLTNIKAAHASFWYWFDYDRRYDYKNRCATWAYFVM